MNFSPIKKEDYSAIKNDLQKLDVIFRTGGTVANYANPYSNNGYGFNFWELVFKGTPTLWALYWEQLFWRKNYLDIIGNAIEGKRVIYVANISKSVDHVKHGINKLVNQYGCKIEAVELGNEHYFNFYGMSPKQYVDTCKKFQTEFQGKYKLLWQLTDMLDTWNEIIIEAPGDKSYSLHYYSKTNQLIDFDLTIGDFLNMVGNNFYLTEWNRKEGIKNEFDIETIKKFLTFLEAEGVKHCFHNVVSDTYGVWKDDLSIRKELFDLFPKV